MGQRDAGFSPKMGCRMWRFPLLSVTFILALVPCGCSGDTRQQIVGKWRPKDSADIEYLEFGADGKLRLQIRGCEQAASGTYKFLDSGTIETDARQAIITALKSQGGQRSAVISWWMLSGKANVAISGNQLTLSEPGGKDKEVYERTK